MREMKDSGIEWIGLIPSTWKVVKVKYNFSNKKIIAGIYADNYERLALTMNGVVKRSKEDANGLQPEKFETYQILNKGELVFKLIDLQNISTSRVGLSSFDGLVSPAYIIIKRNGEIISEFAEKFFLSMWKNQIFNAMGDSGVRSSLNTKDLLEIQMTVPPIEEQQAIADYLDQKCSEIDSLCEDIKKQIETLEQYKRSLITETVTKGLDPNVKMKDSGIEWIGEIPEHWAIHPLYFYFGERKNKNILELETNLLSLSYGKIIRKDINSNGGLLPESFNTYNIIEKDDIIIRPTDLQNDKKSLRTGISKEHGIITSAYLAMKAIKPVNPNYFHYLLHIYDIMKVFYNMGNGVRQGLNFSNFSKLMVFEPPIKEQNDIISYLQEKSSEIDKIISDKNKQLEILAEYKKSLIFECVTGKKETHI